jgi:symplekin
VLDFQLTEFKLPLPKDFSEQERLDYIQGAVKRIREGAAELIPVNSTLRQDVVEPAVHTTSELWMLLLVRMIARVVHQTSFDAEMEVDDKEPAIENHYMRQDEQRRILCDYIMADLPTRVRLASTWMNEEWYNDQIQLSRDVNWVGVIRFYYAFH